MDNCKNLIIKNNEPNICKVTKDLCAEEEGEKCPYKFEHQDRSDCIHRHEKNIGDEGFSFCNLDDDMCVEGDICQYCTEYEPDGDV